MMRCVLLILLFFSSGKEGREEYVHDMQLMKETLDKSENFSTEVIVTNKNIGGFSPSIKAVMHKGGTSIYYKIMHLEYLFTDQRTLMIDHKKKLISYSTADGKFEKQIERWMPSMDSIMMLADSVIYKGTVDGKRKFCIYKSNEIIKYAEVYFDPAVNFISKISYTYNPELVGEDGSVLVEYKAVNFNPVFRSDEFSESRFIKVKGKEVTPSSSLVGYGVSKANTDVNNY